jgi:glycosyltransferase involved in cell wall biosynthesis
MVINVLISTIDQGIYRVKDVILPFRNDVKYIISHQFTGTEKTPIPQELVRKDVVISQIAGRGVTKSRNIAIENATGDICIIADDDVSYTFKYIDNIIEFYKDNRVDIACFKINTGKNDLEYKNYPKGVVRLGKEINYQPSSIEITFLLNSIKKHNLTFDERFGLGSWLNGGGERFFIEDALDKNMDVYFVPKYIVNHPYESTIKNFQKYHKRRNIQTGAIDARINGFLSLIKPFIAVIRYYRDLVEHNKNPFGYLRERISGALYILKTPLNK